MKVKELIQKLSEVDQDLEVEIHEPYDTDIWIDVSDICINKTLIGPFTIKTVRIY